VSFANVMVFLFLGFLLLLEYFRWVLGSVGGAVEVGDLNIYNGIGSKSPQMAMSQRS
jgi:hypothetical protein